MNYYTAKTINKDFETTVQLITESLKSNGFGILTEINVHDVFKNKLEIDFKKYRILGACNPQFAHQAITTEPNIGTMLPCNVIVKEVDDTNTEVVAVNPVASMQAVGSDGLAEIADEVKKRLEIAVQSL